jgi:hypothetical protein
MMGQLGSKMRSTTRGLAHWCPACEEMHEFATTTPLSNGAWWTWDGNIETPTFVPSMNIRVGPDDNGAFEVCHYLLHNGAIEYLADCTHGLRCQRIILPPLPRHLRDSP